jgi:Tol biopolymer transport system component
MKLFKRLHLSRFDRLILAVLGILGLAIAGLALGVYLRGATVVRTFPLDGETTGAREKIGIEFAQEMRHTETQAAFRIDPEVSGEFLWEGKHLWFIPLGALRMDVLYTIRLGKGALNQDGRQMRGEVKWSFRIRQPQALYLSLVGGESGEIWRTSPDSGPGQPFTQTQGKVTGFAPSVDGEWVAYEVLNDKGGTDLWVSDLQEGKARQLVACSPGWCSDPAWSIDGGRIAYSRTGPGPGSSDGMDKPRIWTVDVSSGLTAPLYRDETLTGSGPSWSPDGARLGFYDRATGGIRILELKTGQESILVTSLEHVGSWSPDGRQMLYGFPRLVNEILAVGVNLVDFSNGDVRPALGEKNQGQVDFGLPAWSPDGEWVAIGSRLAGTSESRQLWLIPLDGSTMEEITSDATYTCAAYHWDPWGTALVFQRFPQGQSGGTPEVGVWQRSSRQITMLAKNAALPEWLP